MSSVPLQGVLPAAITPRRPNSVAIDLAAALELVDFLGSHGADGITLLGSTGEFPHFDAEDRMRLAAMACKRSRLPILVNATHSTLDGSVRLAQEAVEAGAAGVLIAPPYYFRYSQESIRAYCLEFAAQVKAPVFLYNIPPFTNPLDLATSLDLLATGAFAGIKDSGGVWDEFEALQKMAGERGLAVFIGADPMYGRARRAGAAGCISGTATVIPELMAAVDRRARAGEDTAAVDALVAEFVTRAGCVPFPIAHREAATLRGLKTGPAASPVGPAEARRLDQFREWFKGWLPDALRLT